MSKLTTFTKLPGYSRNATITLTGDKVERAWRQVDIPERAAIAAVPDLDNDRLASRWVCHGRFLACKWKR